MTNRLPVPGSDNGDWGTILDNFLSVSLNSDGTLNAAAVLAALSGASGIVTGVTAGDASVAVSGTSAAPILKTGTLDQIANLHPPAANWSNNSKKITALANGTVSTDAAAFGQIPVIDSTSTDIQQISSAAATGSTGLVADAGHVHPDPNPLPSDFGWKAWSTDPGNVSSTSAPTTNVVTLIMVFLRATATITNIIASISTSGSGLTASENFAGLYDSSGTLRGVTADMTATWGGAVGAKTMPLASPYVNAPPGVYYVAILSNGTTPPTFRASAPNGTLANAGLSGASLRFCTNGTGTTLPGSLTLSSNSTTNSATVCVVLS